MEYLFNSISEFITPEIVKNTSKILKEENSKVSQAFQTTIASILELIVEKGENKKFESILKGIGNLHILFSVSNLFLDKMNSKMQNACTKFLKYTLNDRLKEYYSLISDISHISLFNSTYIVNKIALLVSAFLGEKLISNISFSALLDQLEDEKNDFQIYIPFELSKLLEQSHLKSFLAQKFWVSFF